MRLRPNVYAGDTTYTTQLFVELFSNALDEHNLGHGNTIYISYDSEKNIGVVSDEGQGIPVNVEREDGKTVLEAAFSVLNTSGKYQDDGVYEGTSLGSYGLGAKLATMLSHELTVMSVAKSKYEQITFKEGVFESREVGNVKRGTKSGVKVVFTPSEEFFTNVNPNVNELTKLVNDICCLCPNLTVVTTFDGVETKHSHPNGISDLVSQDNPVTKMFACCETRGKQKLNLGLQYSDASGGVTAYVNYGLTDTGPHITAVKSVITKVLNTWAKENKLLKKNDPNLDGTSLQDGLSVVFNLVSPGVTYDAQVKSRVTSNNFVPFINEVLSKEFEKWLDNNPQDGKTIIEKALLARRAAEAAKKAREAVKNGKKKDKVFKLPTKLIDAWSKNRSKCEIMIVEGDSAASPLAAARDGEWQAVFPIRGKLINCYKQTHDKLLANQEINNIIQALGLEYNRSTKRLDFDESKLRYGKIIACCDGDADGLEIKNLIFTFFWCFCPELIEKGYVYAAVPPLFRVTTKKNEYVYLRDNRALDEYKKKNQGKIKSINRAKGLGEQDSSELEYCLLNPRTRNIVQLTVSDFQKADKMFVDLYGKKVEPRVRYLMEHSEDANE